jgi:mRNA interferase MazF
VKRWAETVAKPPKAGDIAILDLNPVVGHEQGGRRPNLVVSMPTKYGPGSEELAIAITIPLTTKRRNYWTVVPMNREGGLREESYALCHNIRAVSTKRFEGIIGEVSQRALTRVRLVLGDILHIT